MAFSDPDPIEEQMGVLTGDMSVTQLVNYVKNYHAGFDRRVAINGTREVGVFKQLMSTYGDDAPKLVKWVFYRHHGVWRGEVMGPMQFSSGRKWWTDIMHQEMQAAEHQAVESSRERVAVGSRRLSDL